MHIRCVRKCNIYTNCMNIVRSTLCKCTLITLITFSPLTQALSLRLHHFTGHKCPRPPQASFIRDPAVKDSLLGLAPLPWPPMGQVSPLGGSRTQGSAWPGLRCWIPLQGLDSRWQCCPEIPNQSTGQPPPGLLEASCGDGVHLGPSCR